MSQGNGEAVNATVRRWQLTETLRRLREDAGLTIDQAVSWLKASSGKWSSSKLSRIETRDQGVRAREVVQLLDTYGVSDTALREWVLELAETAHERGYWLALRKDLPEDFHSFLGVESSLIALRQFETMVVPGLLQTPDFTRALINGADPGLAEDVVERRVTARMARQQVLNRSEPLQYHVILEEAVLERPVGGSRVMRNQFRRLVDEASSEHVTIQVLPKSAGATPALDGPFSLLTLPDPIPDFGYAEGHGGGVYIEDRSSVRSCTLKFGILTERSYSQAASMDLFEQAAKRYS
ncbi:Helix-turn-helix domain-containing protein [Actinopolyspora alba]|uniref:Helix-turn-helix domain-containing protein n=1 Tax=Actinopolyspora alba TaxID=673379 RepID=A0A1I1UJB6_9ACTN|nr:helix-turn-helix transcriptional regulator [Actinopolyspora alba]SFD68843.1 Helix-turn-helix domain-containing protein [Actinopolyspora alba]